MLKTKSPPFTEGFFVDVERLWFCYQHFFVPGMD